MPSSPTSGALNSHPDNLSVWWSWPLTFWPWNWRAMSPVARTTFLSIFGASELFTCRVMGKHASNGRREVITLTYDLWGHRARRQCGLSYSIYVPSLKFIGFPVMKIWLILCRGVKRPCDLDLWPSRSRRKLVMWVVLHSCTKFEVRWSSRSEDMAHFLSQY